MDIPDDDWRLITASVRDPEELARLRFAYTAGAYRGKWLVLDAIGQVAMPDNAPRGSRSWTRDLSTTDAERLRLWTKRQPELPVNKGGVRPASTQISPSPPTGGSGVPAPPNPLPGVLVTGSDDEESR